MAFHFNWKGPRIVKENLILYLNASSPNSYVSGDTWKDISGNSYNGDIVNGVFYNGDSFTFDGIDDYLLGSSDLSEITTEITIIFIVKVPDMNNRIPVVTKFNSITPVGWAFELGSASPFWNRTMRFFASYNGTLTLDYRGTVSLNDNQTYMFTVVYKQGQFVDMYYNLNIMTSSHANINWASVVDWNVGTNSYHLGAYDPSFSVYGNSTIFYGSVYNRALTFSEISSIYNQLKYVYNI
jgi:hypothetical protein